MFIKKLSHLCVHTNVKTQDLPLWKVCLWSVFFSHEVIASPVALVLWFVVMHYLTLHFAPETDTAHAFRVKLFKCLKSSWLLKCALALMVIPRCSCFSHHFLWACLFFWICLNTSRDGDENDLAGACFICRFG